LQDVFPEVAVRLGVRIPGQALLALLRDWSLRRAAANVVLSERMATCIIARGAEPARIALIQNWTDDDSIRPRAAESVGLRREWGLGEAFVVEYSGNMGRAHEFATILGAAQQLRANPGIVFLLVGEGHALPPIRDRVVEQGLGNVVIKPPQPRERLAEALAVGDVHLVSLHPSMEGLVVPSKYYGVLAAGRPVIYVGDPDGDLAREILLRECGRVVPAGDAPALASVVLSLRDAAVERQRLGRNARSLLEERYTRRIALDHWKGLLSQLDATRAR
jgi:glycosyltransferase involved in cell wall biosynthesis